MNSQQMIDSLLPTREADCGSACMKCCKPDQHLVKCSACRRVKYCGKACQKADWKRHKPVCKILRVYNEQSKRMVDSFTFSPMARGKANLKDNFERFQDMVTSGPPYASDQLFKELPKNISQDAWQLAKNVVLRSPCCAICNKTDFEHVDEGGSNGAIEWMCCPKCKDGWCCSEHFDGYIHKHTKEMCNTYIRSNNLQRFQYNHTVQHGDHFLAMPDRPLSKPMTSFPTCWESYFKKRMAEEYQFSQRGMLPWEFLPVSTFLLSQVTTCLYGMYQHDRHFFTTTEELTVHVLGPSQTFECEGGGPTCIWEEIMHCLPAVKKMNIIFVGPDFGFDEGNAFTPRPIETCPHCSSKGRIRTQGFYRMTYHDYHNSGEFIRPDFAVAFNPGMYEEYTESWKTSLAVLLTLDVPCIFTSYNEHEGDADFIVLREVNARTLTRSTVLNPFRVEIPKVDEGVIDKFFHDNMYSICFEGYA